MYSFAKRPDTRVVDEPLYGHYLRLSGALHPGRDEVLAAMDLDGDRVVRERVLGAVDRPVLFCKMMAHHLLGLDRAFLQETVNVLLVRDPYEMLPSLVQQIPAPELADTGLAVQSELVRDLEEAGQAPPVLDARLLLEDPEGVLRVLCERLGLAFDPAMLAWTAGARPEDGVWAPHWYHNVHRSTGFVAYRPKTEPFPAGLLPLLEACRPHYEMLSRRAIHAEV
jgi:hypothetical protein